MASRRSNRSTAPLYWGGDRVSVINAGSALGKNIDSVSRRAIASHFYQEFLHQHLKRQQFYLAQSSNPTDQILSQELSLLVQGHVTTRVTRDYSCDLEDGESRRGGKLSRKRMCISAQYKA